MVNRAIKSQVEIDTDKHAALSKYVNTDDSSEVLDYRTFVRVKNDGVYVQHSTGTEFKILNAADKADKFTEAGTTYNLEAIKDIDVSFASGTLTFVDYTGTSSTYTIGDLGFFHYKGSVANEAALPNIDDATPLVEDGDIYTLLDTGVEVYAMGSGTGTAGTGHWDPLDATIQVDSTVTQTSTNPVQSAGIYSFTNTTIQSYLSLSYEEDIP